MERGRGVAAGHYGRGLAGRAGACVARRPTRLPSSCSSCGMPRSRASNSRASRASRLPMLRQRPSLGNSLGTYRIGAYTLGEVRDLIQNRAWQLGLGADVTMYSKPASLDLAYGKHPLSFQIFSADAAGTLRAATSRTLRKQYCSEGFRRRIFCAKASPFGGECPSMIQALKTLRAVQWAMLASIVLYGILGEVVGPVPRGVDPSLSYLFTTLAVAVVGVILVVRRTLVLRAGQSLRARPDDSLSLNHWRTGYIATYALCEALALFGLILRFRGSSWQQSILYYLGGFVLLLFFRPRQPDGI
jgi:hypothetical protein